MNEDYRRQLLQVAFNTVRWASLEAKRDLTDDQVETMIYDLERVLEALRSLIGQSEELKADPREM